MTPAEHFELPADATAPGQARARLRSWLQTRDLEALADSAALLTSELVTNAVLHAGAPVGLSLAAVPAGVRIAVSDCSPTGPSVRHHSREATTGRGLRLLSELAQEWGWEPADDGKVVWCLVSSATDPWAAFADGTWMEDVDL
jgi:anti-sigma regulatory factor (Ser/Thr protein kinase)